MNYSLFTAYSIYSLQYSFWASPMVYQFILNIWVHFWNLNVSKLLLESEGNMSSMKMGPGPGPILGSHKMFEFCMLCGDFSGPAKKEGGGGGQLIYMYCSAPSPNSNKVINHQWFAYDGLVFKSVNCSWNKIWITNDNDSSKYFFITFILLK